MRTKAQRAFDICKADDYLRRAAKLLSANHLLTACQEAELRDLRKHCDDEIGRLDDMEVVEPEEGGVIPF
jgi:hypothetical protein